MIRSVFDANADSDKQTVFNLVAEVDILWERIVLAVCAVRYPGIVIIAHYFQIVSVGRVSSINSGAKTLVEEQLADVQIGATRVGVIRDMVASA